MSERSHSEQYSGIDASSGYSWPSSGSPADEFEQLFEADEALSYAENHHQTNGIPEGYAHASPSYIVSSNVGDFAQNQDVYLTGLLSGPPYLSNSSLHDHHTDQPTQQYHLPSHADHGPFTPDAHRYVQSHADYVDPTQLSSASDNADMISDNEVIHFRRPPRRQRKIKARVGALLPEGQPKSKRAERRAQVLNNFGSVSATDHPKGKTRIRPNGVLEWFNPKTSNFYAAAPLDDYRHQIISEDNALGRYDHAPECGIHQDDVTSFPLDDPLGQQHWNLKDRSAWVHIQDHDGNQVLYLVDKPDRDIEPPNPGFMIYDGKIMLDPDDHPIVDWPGLPRCFSSVMEGARIEAFRRIYPWISLPHFRARMPRWVSRKTVGVQPLAGLSSLQQRLTRFREYFDCPPWKRKHVARGLDLAAHTRERLRNEGLSLESTAGLQPLTRREVLRRKSPYAGRCPENAGLYTLTEEEKQEKAANEASRHEEARAKRQEADQNAAFISSSSGTKRKRQDATEADSSSRFVRKQARSASSATISQKSAHNVAATNSVKSSSDADFDPAEGAVIHEDLPKEDFRWTAPRTIVEQLIIKAALSYTRADYKYYHATEPPSTTATCSYFEQYRQIQDHHKRSWTLEDVPAPQLIYLPEWFGSFQAVPLPNIDEENMERLIASDQADTDTDAKSTTDQHIPYCPI